jgi:tetratricopeptide (TPR) repeat protein
MISWGGKLIAWVPVEIPSNRKARFTKKLHERLVDVFRVREAGTVCFGPRQLKKELPDLPWLPRIPMFCRRFDMPGSPSVRLGRLRSAFRDRPGDELLALRVAQTYLEMGDLRRARRTAEQVLEGDPTNSEAMLIRGTVLLERGDYMEARTVLDHAVSINHDPQARYLAGLASYRAGDMSGAIERFRIAAQKDTTRVDVLVWLAAASAHQGELADALTALWQAAERGLNDLSVLGRDEFESLRSVQGFHAVHTKVRKASETTDRSRPRGRDAQGRPGRTPAGRPQAGRNKTTRGGGTRGDDSRGRTKSRKRPTRTRK